MKKLITKLLLTALLMLSLTLPAYANEFSIMEFGEDNNTLEAKIPEATFSGWDFLKGGYTLYILAKEDTIFEEKTNNTQFCFYEKQLYSINYYLQDTSLEKFNELEKQLNQKYKVIDKADLSNEYQNIIFIKYALPEHIVILSHYDSKIYKTKHTSIDIQQDKKREINL